MWSWQLRELHEQHYREKIESEWRDGGCDLYRQALFDEFPPGAEVDCEAPLPVPEDLLEELDELRHVLGEIYRTKKGVHHFKTETNRVEHHNERARDRGRRATLTDGEWSAIRAGFKNRCAYCESGIGSLLLEHVRPLSCGGDTSADNCVPACWVCNRLKGLRSVEEWLGRARASAFRSRWREALRGVREGETQKPHD